MDNDYFDRRSHCRISIRKKAKCRILSARNSKLKLLSRLKADVQVINLGPGGACVSFGTQENTAAVEKDSVLELSIYTGDDGFLIMTGKVVWCHRTSKDVTTGVSFDMMADYDRDRLLTYLRQELKFTKIDG